MIEKAETEYKELIHKKKVVENDKKKIEDVIDELDQKKNQTLQVLLLFALTLLVKCSRICGGMFLRHGTIQCQASALYLYVYVGVRCTSMVSPIQLSGCSLH